MTNMANMFMCIYPSCIINEWWVNAHDICILCSFYLVSFSFITQSLTFAFDSQAAETSIYSQCGINKVLILSHRSVGYWRRRWRLWLPAPPPWPLQPEGRSPPAPSLRTPSCARWPTGSANRNCWRASWWMADEWWGIVWQKHAFIQCKVRRRTIS